MAIVLLNVGVHPRSQLERAAEQGVGKAPLQPAAPEEAVELHHAVVGDEGNVRTDGQERLEVAPDVVVAQGDLVAVVQSAGVDDPELLLVERFARVGAQVPGLGLPGIVLDLGLGEGAGVVGRWRVHEVDDYCEVGLGVELVSELAVEKRGLHPRLLSVPVVGEVRGAGQVVQPSSLAARLELISLLVVLAQGEAGFDEGPFRAVLGEQVDHAAGGGAV